MDPVKILWVKANKILPVHSGGDIRSYHLARNLAAKHKLVFFSYYDGEHDDAYAQQLAEHFPGAVAVCTGRKKSRWWGHALDYLANLPGGKPYAVSRFESSRVRAALKAQLAEGQFDVAICDFLDAVVNLPPGTNTPCVLFQHNVECEIWRRHAETEANPLKRAVYGLEFRRMLAYEKATVESFPHVIAVSEHDRKLMSEWVDAARITVMPTGVDLEQYGPVASAQNCDRPLVIFVGAMDWEPNIDGVEYFCRQIWPAVQTKLPTARFRIVGRNPDARVLSLASDTVEVTGRVPSVIEHLREAIVVVVPLRIGGGTRLKIYEAMAAGRALVSTSIGAEGLNVHHGLDIVLSDDPSNFADCIVSLVNEVEYRRRMERAAAKLVEQYGWPVIAEKFEEILEGVIRQPGQISRSLAGASQPVTLVNTD
ncbi:MAG TPA: glycosyltransferase family 4 protein [Verrucomicrobiae bacterium]|jgi:polysaccharide biosynthesis protein PslH|nr:glycosyltransferase family 4 protein [Verrucomicrobiae bacterium]